MAICGDNPKLGLVGCGATYSGNQQHCVDRCAGTRHADGRCHETFSTVRVADLHRTRGGHYPPWTITRLMLSAIGVWKERGRGNAPWQNGDRDEREGAMAPAVR